MHQLVQALPTPQTPMYSGEMSASQQELLWSTVHQQWVLIADSTNLPSTFCPTAAHLGGAQTQKNCVLL
jgi:hypothetical protein